MVRCYGGIHLHQTIRSSKDDEDNDDDDDDNDDEYSYYEGIEEKADKKVQNESEYESSNNDNDKNANEAEEEEEEEEEENDDKMEKNDNEPVVISTTKCARLKSKHRKAKHKETTTVRYHHHRRKNNKNRNKQAENKEESENLVKKRNIVLTPVDASQRAQMEEEEEQAKDKLVMEHARLAQDIVNSVIKQSGANMRKALGICQKVLPENFIDMSTELEQHRIVGEVLTSVEEALISAIGCKDCLTLHPDILQFLNWLISGSTAQTCCIPVNKMRHNKNYFLFDPHHHLYGEKCKQNIGSINGPLVNEQNMFETTCANTGFPSSLVEANTQSVAQEGLQMSHAKKLMHKEIADDRLSRSRKKFHNIVSIQENVDQKDNDKTISMLN